MKYVPGFVLFLSVEAVRIFIQFCFPLSNLLVFLNSLRHLKSILERYTFQIFYQNSSPFSLRAHNIRYQCFSVKYAVWAYRQEDQQLLLLDLSNKLLGFHHYIGQKYLLLLLLLLEKNRDGRRKLWGILCRRVLETVG